MKTCYYPSDLTDAEWEILAPLVPAAKPGGRPRKHGGRELLNAMFYLVRAGCAWRLLPWHFGLRGVTDTVGEPPLSSDTS